jgi:hypothetical protein
MVAPAKRIIEPRMVGRMYGKDWNRGTSARKVPAQVCTGDSKFPPSICDRELERSNRLLLAYRPHDTAKTPREAQNGIRAGGVGVEPRNLDQHRPQIVTYDSDGSTEYSLDEPDADRLWQLIR